MSGAIAAVDLHPFRNGFVISAGAHFGAKARAAGPVAARNSTRATIAEPSIVNLHPSPPATTI